MTMASRNELEAWSDRWLKANQEAEKAGKGASKVRKG